MQNLSTANFTCVFRFLIIMEDITKFFQSYSKKGDLNDTSKADDNPKKIREASLQVLEMKVMFLMKVLIC